MSADPRAIFGVLREKLLDSLKIAKKTVAKGIHTCQTHLNSDIWHALGRCESKSNAEPVRRLPELLTAVLEDFERGSEP